jgi:cytochrome c peroxidase
MRALGRMALALVAMFAASCGSVPTYPDGPYGFDIDQTIPDLTFDSVRLRDAYEPNAPASRLLVVRVGAAWCGTCRWHLGHTAELLALDIGPSLSILDLVIADEDNVPATPDTVASYRALIDAETTVASDPGFQLAPAMFTSGALPLVVVVDRRTMKVKRALNDPDPDALERELKTVLNRLNKTTLAPGPTTDGPDGLHRNQWDLLREMALPGAPPPDPTNAKADDPAAAALGRALYSDASLSPSGTVSCATCHDPSKGFADGRPQSVGVATGDRNAPSVLFASHARWQFWDGRADSLWAQALGPFENPKEFDSSRLFVAHAVYDRYRAQYEAIFGPMPSLGELARFPPAGKPGTSEWQRMTVDDQRAVTRVFANVGKAIAAFERTLRAKPNALDRYIAGDSNALTDEQKDSVRAYFRGGCAQCHYGPRLTDDAFHTLRFPTGRSDGRGDPGREEGVAKLVSAEFLGTGAYSDAPTTARNVAAIAPTANMLGAFKTPPIRGAADTAPYGHGGAIPTLLDLAKLYGKAGLPADDPAAIGTREPWLPLFLEGDAPKLVPFLEILTAEPIVQ